MPERGKRTEQLQDKDTILSEEYARFVLRDAKTYLMQFGGLPTTLLMSLNDGNPLQLPLSLPQHHQQKCVYFQILRESVRRLNREIHEAIMIAESWYVAQSDPHLEVSPSQHPQRKEAITLVGRDHTGLKSIFALQPFGRDKDKNPLFEPLEIQQFDGTDPTAFYWVGLLDYLFPQDRSTFTH